MSKGKVLIAGTNARRIETIGGGWGRTGQYLNETVVPAMAVIDAGYEVVLATPDGTQPYIDPASDAPVHFDNDEAAYRKAKAFYAEDPSMTNVRTFRSILDEGLDNYSGLFAPGGQGPVVDLMQDAELGEIVRHFHQRSKPTAFLCHGPICAIAGMTKAREFRAALIAGVPEKAAEWARDWPYKGYNMTIFSSTEEEVIEDTLLHAKIYFHMPQTLELAGAKVTTGPDFEPYVVEDRELITGQNPRSDHPIGEKLVAALERALVAA